ncbi:MAG: DMT family transporter [Pseudomonadota bacterium]
MGELIVAMAGTPTGERAALALALLSALSHAVFGAVVKGGADAHLNRGAINICYAAIAAPFALFVFPPPTPQLWAILAGVYVIHLIYEYTQVRSLSIGGFTVVYPLARGTGPMVTAIAAGIVFGEAFTGVQWAGLLVLTLSIYGLAWANLQATGLDGPAAIRQLRAAIATALLSGVMIAIYTVYDAYGIRVADDPFTFLAWFFVVGGFGYPVIAAIRWRRMTPPDRPDPRKLALRGFCGALIAFVSFGSVMLAMRLDKVGEAAAVREMSIVFATAIGVLIFREKIDARRLALIGGIVAGAIVIEAAG